MSRRDQPYLPLYIQDFLTDEKLAECSASATGIYIRLMCLMHKSDTYGKILLKQKYKQNTKQILNFASQVAKHFPYPLLEVESGLTELLDEGVLIIEGDFLVQKRMVRDEDISYKRALSGSKGGKKNQPFEKRIEISIPNFAQAKSEANSEYENENTIEFNKINKEYPFNDFWEAYDYKVGDTYRLEQHWHSLPGDVKQKILAFIPEYVASTPIKKFRLSATRFFEQRRWEGEILKDTIAETVPANMQPTEL
jgi:hypothetical protein